MLSKTLNFVSIDFPPYVYKNKGEVVGFNVEILNLIFSKLNFKVNYYIVPWPRAIKMIEAGEADAIFPFFKTPERELFADYSDSFTSEPIAMFVLSPSNIYYDGDLSQLSSYTIGRVRGYSSGVRFDGAVKNSIINLQIANNSDQNLKKLFKQRFDILVDNKYYILNRLKQLNKNNDVKQLNPILINKKAYLGFSKVLKHKKLISDFNIILKSLKEDGSYDKILKSYFAK